MKRHLRLTPVLLLAALLAGCQGPCEKLGRIAAPTTSAGSADFSRFVAVGTSISAGYQSGGLVNRHQVYAYPALFAKQTGKTVQLDGQGTFSLPAVDGNGLAPLLQLRSLSPVIISNSGLVPGTPINTTWPTPYSNLGVPGAILYDFTNLTNYGTGLFPLVARGANTLQTQLLAQNPTFISFEFGANEVLGPATSGSAVTPAGVPASTWNAIASPAAYGAMLGGALATIHGAAPTAKIAIANVPDVRSIPFFTTFPPLTKDVRNGAVRGLLGWVHRDSAFTIHVPVPAPHDSTGHTIVIKLDSLTVSDLVTLKAQASLYAGIGFRPFTYNYVANTLNGTGAGLDSAFVLDSLEQVVIGGKVATMNAAVDARAASAWIVKVDLNGLLASLTTNGTTIRGTHYTTAYVSGGLFSLDGVHPTDLGHALIANLMINAVNAKFGSTLPNLVLPDYTTGSSSQAQPVRAGEKLLNIRRIDGLGASLRALFDR